MRSGMRQQRDDEEHRVRERCDDVARDNLAETFHKLAARLLVYVLLIWGFSSPNRFPVSSSWADGTSRTARVSGGRSAVSSFGAPRTIPSFSPWGGSGCERGSGTRVSFVRGRGEKRMDSIRSTRRVDALHHAAQLLQAGLRDADGVPLLDGDEEFGRHGRSLLRVREQVPLRPRRPQKRHDCWCAEGSDAAPAKKSRNENNENGRSENSVSRA